MNTRAAQTTRRNTRRTVRFTLHPLGLAALMLFAGSAGALPQGATVVAGKVTVVNKTPRYQLVTQSTDKAIIDWKSFSIAGDETVRFNQPSATAVLLNRVTGVDPSAILGRMESNGQIFLLNPYGVIFGANARIDVGGMVASTLSIANADFLASRYALTSDDGVSASLRGVVRNEGSINAPGGTVVLAGPRVENTGSIEAAGGRVGLAAANSVLVDVEGDGLIFFNTSATEAGNRLQQLGRIQADGGSVELRAAARGAFADTVLNMAGVVQARSIGTRNGQVVIDGGDAGITRVAGSVDASGAEAGTRGGEVTVLGQKVLLDEGASLNASGPAGGGTVLVGGNWQGQGPQRNAQMAHVAAGARIDVSATNNGDGGTAVVWADNDTRYFGHIDASGGVAGGNGGKIEVSGKNTLTFDGTAAFSAPNGAGGLLLLDPSDITISAGANTAISGATPFQGSANTSTLNVTTLVTALNTGGAGDIVVDASGGAGGAANGGTITVATPVAWAGVKNLTLQSGGGITVNGASAISNTGSGGLNFFTDGAVLLNSSVTLNGGSFTVAGTTGLGGTGAASFSGTAGAISAAITTSSSVNSRPGGNVSVSTLSTVGTGNINVGAINARGSNAAGTTQATAGGNVTLSTTNGTIQTAGIDTRGGDNITVGNTFAGGKGGNVTVTAAPTAGAPSINLGTITARGGAGSTGAGNFDGGAGGAGGTITVTTTTSGSVTTAGVDSTGGGGGDAGAAGNSVGGAGGAGGAITLTAHGAGENLTTNGALTSAGGSGGAGAGNLLGGAGGTGGGIALNGNSGANVNATLSLSSGGGNGGTGGDTANGAPGGAGGSITVNAGGTTGATVSGAVSSVGGVGGNGGNNGSNNGGIGGAGGQISVTASAAGASATVSGSMTSSGGQGGANNAGAGTSGGGGAAQTISVSATLGAASIAAATSLGGDTGAFGAGTAGAAGASATVTATAGTDLTPTGAVNAGSSAIALNFGKADGGGTLNLTNAAATFTTSGAVTASGGAATNTDTLLLAPVAGQNLALTNAAVTRTGVNPSVITLTTTAGNSVDAATITAGTGTTTLSGWTGGRTANVQLTAGAGTIVGNGGGTTLTAVAGGSAFSITGASAGTAGGTNFSAVGALAGGIGNDSFTLAAAVVAFNGAISGGGGTNTLATTDGNNAFAITGANAGTLGATTFTGITTVNAGTGNDSFTFGAGVTDFNGTLNGGSGTNALVLTNGANAITLSGLNAGTLNSTTSFTGIATLTGGADTDTLTGLVAGTPFNITGAKALTVAGIDATSIDALVGRGGNDTFTLGAGVTTFNGSIDGGAGNNVLTLTDGTNAISVTGANAGSVNATTTFTGIATLNGGIGTDTLTGPAAGAAYGITGANAVTVAGIGVTSIEALVAGGGTNTFTLGAGVLTFNGSIDGGAGSSTLATTNGTNSFAITGDKSGALNTSTTFSNISTLAGGSGTDTLVIANDVTSITLSDALLQRTGLADINLSAGLDAATVTGGVGDNAINVSGWSGTATITATAGTDVVTGNGANTTLVGPASGPHAYAITGPRAGTVDGVAGGTTFSGVGTINAGTGDDSFTFGTLVTTFNGTLNGGTGTNALVLTDGANAITLSAANAGTLNTDTNFTGISALTGGIGTDTLTGLVAGTPFSITGARAVTVAGIDATSIEALVGRGGNDTFTLGAAVTTFNGSIDGGAGTNVLTLTNGTNAISVSGANAGSVNGTTTFSNIATLNGGSGTDTLTGPAAGTAYSITGANAVTVAGTNATSIEALVGGSGGDTFTLGAGIVNFVGSIDGGAGSNTLAATNGANAFAISGPNAGTLNTITTFTNIGNLTGGTGTDGFVFAAAAGATLTGNVNGGTGTNTLDLSAKTGPVVVNQQSATATDNGSAIVAGFSNIGVLAGSTNTSTELIGLDAGQTFTLTGDRAGTAGGLSFTGVGTLAGGTGTDRIVLALDAANITLTDSSIAATGRATINLSGFEAATLTGGASANAISVAGWTGTRTAIINATAGADTVTGTTTAALADSRTTLVGTNTGSLFTITGENVGTLFDGTDTTAFNDVGNLTGGTASDVFALGLNGSLTGTVDGGLGALNTLNLSAKTTATITIQQATGAVSGTGFDIGGSVNIGAIVGNGANTTLQGGNAGAAYAITAADQITVNAGAQVFDGVGNLAAGTGADSITGSGGSLVGNISDGGGATTLSGTITTGGTQTYTGVVTAPTVNLVASGNITATNAANNFGTLSVSTSDPTLGAGVSVNIVDANSIAFGTVSLLGTGANSFTAGAAPTSAFSRTGVLTATNAPTLTVGGVAVNAGVRDFFTGATGAAAAVQVQAGAAGVHNLTATGVSAALPTLNVTGNLDLTAATSLTQAGPPVSLVVAGTSRLESTGGSVLLDNAGNDFGGAVTAIGAAVSLRDSNALNVASLTSTLGQDVSLVAGGALVTPAGAINTGAGNLTLSSGATLTTPGALTGNNLALTGATGLNIGANVTATGTLGLNTTNAAVNQTAGVIAATGATTVTAGTGAVTLAQGGNNFSSIGFAGATRGAVNVADTNDLVVTALPGTANQALTLTAAGLLTLPAPGFAIDTGTANLTLSFGSIGSALGNLRGNNVAITGTGGLASLGNVNAAGTLNLTTTNAAIGQAGGTAVVAAGATTVAAGSGAVNLANAGNDFSTIGVTGGAVSLRDSNALTVSALTSGANQAVSVIAGGALSLPAAAINTGTADLTLSSGGSLSTPGALTGANISLTGATGVGIGNNVTASGALSLTSTNAAITQSGGTITAGGATTVSAGTGAVTLAQAGNNFASIGVTGGAVSLVDTGAVVLNAINAGSLTLNTSTGNGAVTQSAPAVVSGATSINAGTGAVTLLNAGNNFGSIGVTGGAVQIRDQNALALDATNATSLTIDTAAGNGAVSQNAALAVTGLTTVTAGSGNVTLANAANNFGSVAVSGGAIDLRDANAINLASATVGAGQTLRVTAGGTITLNGNITTSADQTFAGNVLLAANTTLDAGVGRISLQGTVDGGTRDLTLTSTAAGANAITVGGAASNLGVFTANGGTTLAGNVTSTGTQTYNGSLALGGNATLDAGAGKVDLRGTVDAGGNALAATSSNAAADAIRVGGAVSNASTFTATGRSTLAANVTTTGNQTYTGPVVLAANTTLNAGAGSIALQSTLDGGTRDLTLASTGAGANAISTGGAMSNLGVFNANGNATLGGNVTSSGTQTYTGAVALTANSTLNAGAGKVALQGAVNAGGNAFAATSGNAAADAIRVGGAISNASTFTATGNSTLAANVTTSGNQTYTGPVLLTTDTTLNAGAGSIALQSTLDGGTRDLTLASTGAGANAISTGGAMSNLGVFNANGNATLGGNVTSSGTQTYTGAVALTASSTLNAGAGKVALQGAVNGGGNAFAATSSNVAADAIRVGGAISNASSFTATGNSTLAANVTTTGNQTYTGPVLLAADSALNAGAGRIALQGTVDGGTRNLTLASIAGGTNAITVGGAATNLGTFTVNGSATLGGDVTSTGAQAYSAAVTTSGNRTFTGSSLSFGGTVSGATDLALRTDNLTTTGAVTGAGGGTLSIAPLDAARNISVAGGAGGGLEVTQALLTGATGFASHVIGRTSPDDGSGNITAGNLTLGANTTLQTATGNITLSGTVDGGFDLVLNSGGTTQFGGAVGVGAPLRSLTIDGRGTPGEGTRFEQAGGTRVVTTGTQTYGDAITATVPLVLDGSVITALLKANSFAGAISSTATTLNVASAGTITLGDVTLANGGGIESDAGLVLTGQLQLNGGTLVLVGGSGTPSSNPPLPASPVDPLNPAGFTAPEQVGRTDAAFGTIPIRQAASAIDQTGGTVTSAANSLLVLRSPNGGSIRVEQAGNAIAGEISAVSGTLNEPNANRFDTSSSLVLGYVGINSTQIRVAGAPPVDGAQDTLRAGIEGDVVRLSADRLFTGTQGEIVARLPFITTQGSGTSMPALTLVMSPQALLTGGQFGGEADGTVQVRIGDARGGFVTVRPKGVSGETAYILLSGSFASRPFYDGAGKLSEIRVFYNGDSARTPQESGALSAVTAVVEEAREARFQEAVRTENVSSRLRSGVIAEVGAGRPATVGRESIRLPDNCEPKPSTLLCK